MGSVRSIIRELSKNQRGILKNKAMARKQSIGIRKPMSPEVRARIADSVRLSAEKKRMEAGVFIEDKTHESPPLIHKPLELVQMKNQTFSEDLFIPMRTGKPIDLLYSNDGGIPKACNFIIIGAPGLGKSTVSMDIAADLHKRGFKVLFVSAEMTRIDLFGYVKRYPKFGELPTLFLSEYLEHNPKAIIEQVFSQGYDLILLDSFAEIQSSVREASRITINAAEKWLIDLMVSHNTGNNEAGKNTTFLAIQQVTKGGVFVGSNKLKHNTTGMMELIMDPDSQIPYVTFTKNRRCQIGERLSYSLAGTGDVQYYTYVPPVTAEDEDDGDDA
jgi:predicted ATP-dependent serine protease